MRKHIYDCCPSQPARLRQIAGRRLMDEDGGRGEFLFFFFFE